MYTDASLFSFSSLNWLETMTSVGQSREAADSGSVGVLVQSSKWDRCERRRKEPLRLVCFEEWDTAVVYRPIEDKRFAQREAKGPEFNNASITGQPTCSYDMYGKNYLGLQLFFFFPRDNCWDLILMLFCVVLYFHAKILLYLNVFILLNVFKFFFFFFGYYTLELL